MTTNSGRRVDWHTNERVDVTDLDRVATLNADYFKELFSLVLGLEDRVLADGYKVTKVNNTTVRVTNTQDKALVDAQGILVNQLVPSKALNLTITANGTYYIEVQASETDTDSATRRFWDVSTQAESTLAVTTTVAIDWTTEAHISPTPGWTTIATVVKAGDVITDPPTDARKTLANHEFKYEDVSEELELSGAWPTLGDDSVGLLSLGTIAGGQMVQFLDASDNIISTHMVTGTNSSPLNIEFTPDYSDATAVAAKLVYYPRGIDRADSLFKMLGLVAMSLSDAKGYDYGSLSTFGGRMQGFANSSQDWIEPALVSLFELGMSHWGRKQLGSVGDGIIPAGSHKEISQFLIESATTLFDSFTDRTEQDDSGRFVFHRVSTTDKYWLAFNGRSNSSDLLIKNNTAKPVVSFSFDTNGTDYIFVAKWCNAPMVTDCTPFDLADVGGQPSYGLALSKDGDIYFKGSDSWTTEASIVDVVKLVYQMFTAINGRSPDLFTNDSLWPTSGGLGESPLVIDATIEDAVRGIDAKFHTEGYLDNVVMLQGGVVGNFIAALSDDSAVVRHPLSTTFSPLLESVAQPVRTVNGVNYTVEVAPGTCMIGAPISWADFPWYALGYNVDVDPRGKDFTSIGDTYCDGGLSQFVFPVLKGVDEIWIPRPLIFMSLKVEDVGSIGAVPDVKLHVTGVLRTRDESGSLSGGIPFLREIFATTAWESPDLFLSVVGAAPYYGSQAIYKKNPMFDSEFIKFTGLKNALASGGLNTANGDAYVSLQFQYKITVEAGGGTEADYNPVGCSFVYLGDPIGNISDSNYGTDYINSDITGVPNSLYNLFNLYGSVSFNWLSYLSHVSGFPIIMRRNFRTP